MLVLARLHYTELNTNDDDYDDEKNVLKNKIST